MRTKKSINPTFDNFILVSPKQIELAIYIRQFRRVHELSQKEMAKICSIYGESKNVKFHQREISGYENCKTVPTTPKFQALMNTMDITSNML